MKIAGPSGAFIFDGGLDCDKGVKTVLSLSMFVVLLAGTGVVCCWLAIWNLFGDSNLYYFKLSVDSSISSESTLLYKTGFLLWIPKVGFANAFGFLEIENVGFAIGPPWGGLEICLIPS